MRFLHLSDLHLGKRFKEFSMISDQKYILNQVLDIIDNSNLDFVILAGDIYDKSIPPTSAIELFNDFLVSLVERNLKVFIISGNHDSSERLCSYEKLTSNSGIFFSNTYDGTIKSVCLSDVYGDYTIHLLPFIKPSHVNFFAQSDVCKSYTQAVSMALQSHSCDFDSRNILVSHQFVTGAITCDSEEFSVGGLDNIDASVFHGFDYVALGHIHRPQRITSDFIRYCGSPLKYSFSECNHKKSVTIVEICEKNNTTIEQVELVPLRDVRELSGVFSDIILMTKSEDYIHVILHDDDEIFDAISRIRQVFPNVMSIAYDNERTRMQSEISGVDASQITSPFDIFAEFFNEQNNSELSQAQSEFMQDLCDKIWG